MFAEVLRFVDAIEIDADKLFQLGLRNGSAHRRIAHWRCRRGFFRLGKSFGFRRWKLEKAGFQKLGNDFRDVIAFFFEAALFENASAETSGVLAEYHDKFGAIRTGENSYYVLRNAREQNPRRPAMRARTNIHSGPFPAKRRFHPWPSI